MEAMSSIVMRKAKGTYVGFLRALRSTPHVKARFGRVIIYKFADGTACADAGYKPYYGFWSEFQFDVNKDDWGKVLDFMS